MWEFIIKYWLEVVFGLATSFLAVAYRLLSKKFKRHNSEHDLLKDGLLAILHDRIYQACEFNLQRGYCSIEEKKNIEYLYNSYHALGGNGTGTEIYNRVQSLPIKTKE